MGIKRPTYRAEAVSLEGTERLARLLLRYVLEEEGQHEQDNPQTHI